MSPQGEGINLPPLAPIAEDGGQFRPAHGGQKCFHPGLKVGDIIRFQPGYGEIVRNALGKCAADIHYAADHAHAGTFAKDGRKPFAIITADHGLAPAHELEGKTAHILEHPQFRRLIKGIVLHERTGSRPCPAADMDDARRRTVPGGVARIPAHDNAASRVEPAYVGGRGAVHKDFRIVEAHGTDALAGVGHMEPQGLAFPVPQRAADVVLARRFDFKRCLAVADRFLNGEKQVLGRHAVRPLQCLDCQHVAPS